MNQAVVLVVVTSTAEFRFKGGRRAGFAGGAIAPPLEYHGRNLKTNSVDPRAKEAGEFAHPTPVLVRAARTASGDIASTRLS